MSNSQLFYLTSLLSFSDLKNPIFQDFVIYTGPDLQPNYINKTFFAMISSYFQREIEKVGGLSNFPSSLHLPDIPTRSFILFTSFIQKGQYKFSPQDALSLLKLAIRLEINKLIEFISEKIEFNYDMFDPLELLVYSEEAGSDYLYKFSLSKVLKMGDLAFFKETLENFLPERTFIQLLQNPGLRVSEIVKVNAIVRWGLQRREDQSDEIRKYVSNLVKYVNFESLTLQELTLYVEKHNLLSENEFQRLYIRRTKEKLKLKINNNLTEQSANQPIKMMLTNYAQQVDITQNSSCIEKIGTQEGCVVLSHRPLRDLHRIQMTIVKLGNNTYNQVGIGITALNALNYSPFMLSRTSGDFIAFYCYKNQGVFNFASNDHIKKFQDIKQPSRGFSVNDIINLDVDMDDKQLVFGVNGENFDTINFESLAPAQDLHLAVWTTYKGDQLVVTQVQNNAFQ